MKLLQKISKFAKDVRSNITSRYSTQGAKYSSKKPLQEHKLDEKRQYKSDKARQLEAALAEEDLNALYRQHYGIPMSSVHWDDQDF